MGWLFDFNSIWLWLGGGGVLVVGLALAGYFLPPFRTYLWGAAAVAAVLLGSYGKGVRDAAQRAKEQQRKDEATAIQRANRARDRARADRADGVRDPWDSDEWK